MNQFYQEALDIRDDLLNWRRTIHQAPETGMDLPNTVALVCDALRSMGYEPRRAAGGVVAYLDGGRPGKTFLLRADMDALPMPEETDLPFASRVPNAAHTCGHDIHTACLLGAAKILMAHRAEITGRVKLVFQAGEEVAAGAKQMVEAGVLDNVDACLALHTLVANDPPTGTLTCAPGPNLASTDLFHIQVTGKGCHGARPETGINVVNILCHIHTLLQTVITQEKPQQSPAVMTIGRISAGSAPNVLPGSGFMEGTIRAFDPDVRALVKRRLAEVAEGAARTLGGTAVVTFSTGIPAVICDEEVAASMLDYMRELAGEDHVRVQAPRMASEDYAEFTTRVPGAFIRLSCGCPQEGYTVDAHNPKVVFNEEALPTGAAAYAYGAFRWLEAHPG